MDLLTFISDFPDRVESVADEAGTKAVYLRQIARRHRNASHRLAKAIERATDGAVTVQDLRPDIFGDPPPAQPTETGVASEEPPAERRVA